MNFDICAYDKLNHGMRSLIKFLKGLAKSK